MHGREGICENAMSATPIATGRSATGIGTGKLAVWWVIGSEIVIFGGLLASYVMHRLDSTDIKSREGAFSFGKQNFRLSKRFPFISLLVKNM